VQQDDDRTVCRSRINNVKNKFTAAELLHRDSIPDGGLPWSEFALELTYSQREQSSWRVPAE
jgi:hypothetical protein